MSRSTRQPPTLQRLQLVYRRMLALAVPAALASCQGTADPLAPDAAGEPSVPVASAPEAAAPAPNFLATLASNGIAFVSYTSTGGADIWSMDPQGANLAHLTGFTGLEFMPSWSPDHKHIAFVRIRNGGYTDIFLVDADGTHKHWARTAAYQGGIDMPSWSPDGTHLLVRVVYQGLPCLGKIDLATENLSLVAPAGLFAVEGMYPIYDPTGQTIIYLDRSLKTFKRFTPGGALTTVFSFSDYVGQPAISPDGTKLAYYGAVNSTNAEIHVLNLATKTTKRLTYNSATDVQPSWSPDGTKLAFASKRSGKMQVWTMNSSTGGSLTPITSKSYGASQPAWR